MQELLDKVISELPYVHDLIELIWSHNSNGRFEQDKEKLKAEVVYVLHDKKYEHYGCIVNGKIVSFGSGYMLDDGSFFIHFLLLSDRKHLKILYDQFRQYHKDVDRFCGMLRNRKRYFDWKHASKFLKHLGAI